MQPLAILLVLAAAHVTTSMGGAHDLSLVVMAPFPDELTAGWSRGPALIPAARIAVREINNRTDILPDFNLKLIIADSGCSTTSKVTISLLRDIYENKDHQVVGIVGPGCSGAALRLSNFISRYQVSLIHVTPSATSPELEDPKRNTTYATTSSALSFVESFMELMEYNNWENVATLVDENRVYFTQTHSGFMAAVPKRQIIYSGSLLAGRNGAESVIPLDALQSSRARVVMVFAGAGVATQLLCYAFHRKMLYPNYQWIFHDRTAGQLVNNITTFRVDGRTLECSDKQMATATHGVVLNQFHLTSEDRDSVSPLLRKSYNDYYKEYKDELEQFRVEMNLTENPPNRWANPYHDAVWAMALALHNASENGVDLRTYTYNMNNETMEIARHLSRVNFDGVTGPVQFRSKTRSAKTVIDIKQILNGKVKLIGAFDRTSREKLNFTSEESIFINDRYEEKHRKVHIAVGVITILVTAFLFVSTALQQLANTVWYRYHSVKATSPNITHLIFSGCYLFSIALLILAVQETFISPSTDEILYAILCNLFTWCFLVGYSLIFGTICTKIWRVYRLFKHFRNERPGHFLTDNSLVMFVTILITVDVLFCITWNLADPWVVEVTETPSTSGTPTIFIRSKCTCTHLTSWVIAASLYKGTLTLVLVALSILNRRVKRKDFQHTRKVNTLIYGVTMLAGVGLPLYFLLDHISLYIGFVILFAILTSTVLLSSFTLFLPPLVPVIKYKFGIVEEKPMTRTLKNALSRASLMTVTSVGDY